ncbi:MAG: hypothetical protein OMM_09340 [Candidatus Magnetoglobus multicellularis str. Araruama]|uniref:Uncharacterized protein n=1 Tax=Candidatus Magnetoglobus multicellularis str. Araruama TaxID=890399 RepID=A0A1V1P4B6_9BACT|nr:MAG: hypothetical protein OMM_09340 [Candidatus Magnetoglobus multicellularis str. Araruama]
MNFDPESILEELTGEEAETYPEMAVQGLLELGTVTEYIHKKEKTREKDIIDNIYTLSYEMGMFAEDELSLLEKEYRDYLGFSNIETHLRTIQLARK